MNPKTTNELLQILNSAEKASELEQYTEILASSVSPISFPAYINEKLADHHLSAADVIRASEIQRNYGYQILNGQKQPSRDKVIALCLALSLSLNETQRALTISQNGLLYPRIRRDSVLIFSVNKNLSVSQSNELLYETGEKGLQ